MDLSQLKSKTPRKVQQRVGRGGKRGTYSGKGMKGQKSRAGAGFKPGFRGGDNRIWQLFPKQRGASKKPGSNRPHKKHRFFQLRHKKPSVLNLEEFNIFDDGQVLTPEVLVQKGLVSAAHVYIKILGDGDLKKKLEFHGFDFSASARNKILKAGGKITK